MPELHLIAGPNGSGKSTFVREVQGGARTTGSTLPPVINPDETAIRLNAEHPDAAAVAAARLALRERQYALIEGKSFAIETTFSGNSERRLITDTLASGYRVMMTYIALDD